jgi:GMP synthase (glutamine-hydrolysing)
LARPYFKGGVAVLDFGGQYSHLICRRIRELGVYAGLLDYGAKVEELEELGVAGVVLSGGPASVFERGAPHPDPRLFRSGLPVLGICYGYQLMVEAGGGRVAPAARREYGRAKLRILKDGPLFEGLGSRELVCWMSHGDSASELPAGFTSMASSENSPFAAIASADGMQTGVQFHPEVSHTEEGGRMLANFVLGVCRAERNWSLGEVVKRAREEAAGLEGRILCAVSGGVDSTVTAVLLNEGAHDRLSCLFVDTGLLREGEAGEVMGVLRDRLGVPVKEVDASARFLGALKGVTDPEEKRRVVGRVFAEEFERFSKEEGPFSYLAQGTLYPDVVESGRTGSPSSTIKTHHNVGGLPPGLSMKLVEPLRDLYKDEVRKIGRLLGMPEELVGRHPFPGPGLAVRVLGEVTREKLEISRRAGAIVEETLMKRGLYGSVWQAFAYVGDDVVTGVQGDGRRTGRQVTVKVVESVDAMTADWVGLPAGVLREISGRITNEVEGVVAVAYAISSKPPATIEPQ